MTTSFNGMNGVGGSRSRTVLITGASKGLGRALALELAKKGHTVIGCSRTHDKLNSLQSELSSPDNHLFLNADVVSPSLPLSLSACFLS
jgi:short-subunit dehydrogenase